MKNKDNGLDLVLIVSLVLVVGVWILFPSIVPVLNSCGIGVGEFGDQFGSLNTLFTGLAFALLIYTAFMQRKELHLQRDELNRTREEFEKQTDLQEEHLEMLRSERLAIEKSFERDNSPKLMLRFVQHRGDCTTFRLINGGAPIYDLSANSDLKIGVNKITLKDDTILDCHKHVELYIYYGSDLKVPLDEYAIFLSFTTPLDERKRVRIEYKRMG